MTGGLGGIVGSIVDGLGGLLGSLMGGGSGMGREPIDLDDADDPRVDDAGELEDAEEPAVLDEEAAPAAPVAESQPAAGESVALPVTRHRRLTSHRRSRRPSPSGRHRVRSRRINCRRSASEAQPLISATNFSSGVKGAASSPIGNVLGSCTSGSAKSAYVLSPLSMYSR